MMQPQTILKLHNALDVLDDTDLGGPDKQSLAGLVLKALGFKGIEGGGTCLADVQMTYTYGSPDPFKAQREQGQQDFDAQYDAAEKAVVEGAGLSMNDPLEYRGPEQS